MYTREEEISLFKMVCTRLSEIHRIKSETYQDSWQKRGEVISVFGNIARKFDRLEQIFKDPVTYGKAINGELGEALEDTILDLAVYSLLHCVYVLKNRPSAFLRAYNRATGGTDGDSKEEGDVG